MFWPVRGHMGSCIENYLKYASGDNRDQRAKQKFQGALNYSFKTYTRYYKIKGNSWGKKLLRGCNNFNVNNLKLLLDTLQMMMMIEKN